MTLPPTLAAEEKKQRTRCAPRRLQCAMSGTEFRMPRVPWQYRQHAKGVTPDRTNSVLPCMGSDTSLL